MYVEIVSTIILFVTLLIMIISFNAAYRPSVSVTEALPEYDKNKKEKFKYIWTKIRIVRTKILKKREITFPFFMENISSQFFHHSSYSLYNQFQFSFSF